MFFIPLLIQQELEQSMQPVKTIVPVFIDKAIKIKKQQDISIKEALHRAKVQQE